MQCQRDIDSFREKGIIQFFVFRREMTPFIYHAIERSRKQQKSFLKPQLYCGSWIKTANEWFLTFEIVCFSESTRIFSTVRKFTSSTRLSSLMDMTFWLQVLERADWMPPMLAEERNLLKRKDQIVKFMAFQLGPMNELKLRKSIWWKMPLFWQQQLITFYGDKNLFTCILKAAAEATNDRLALLCFRNFQYNWHQFN